MARALVQIDFFTDHNIPDSVGNYLRGRGHRVFRQRHHIAADAPDQIVATAALKAGRVLVTWDKDFNAQRFAQARFAELSRISLSGAGPDLLPALRRQIRTIEFRWSEKVRTRAARMIAHVGPGQVRFRN
jgi:hypothetical protein